MNSTSQYILFPSGTVGIYNRVLLPISWPDWVRIRLAQLSQQQRLCSNGHKGKTVIPGRPYNGLNFTPNHAAKKKNVSKAKAVRLAADAAKAS